MSQSKRNSLLLFSAAGLLVLFLAMSLPDLVLSPGQPFSLEKLDTETPPGTDSSLQRENENGLEWLFRGIIALALILFPIHIIYSLLSSKGRRRLLRDLIVVAVLLLLANYLYKHPLRLGAKEESEVSSSANQEAGNSIPAVDFPADPPAWLTLTVILVISATVVSVLFGIVWYLRRRGRRPGYYLEELAETAQNTIDFLQAGGNFNDAVIRCYQEMSRVVKESRGIARETAMTPREFEAHLVHNGLPRDATVTLTRLFEQVRYGSMSADDQQENMAISCLTDIVAACKTLEVRYDSL